MKKFLLALLLFLLWALFAMWFHQTQSEKFCGACTDSHALGCGTEGDLDKANANLDTNLGAFSIMDVDGKSIFNFPAGFKINSKDCTVIIPDNISGFKDSIFNYLNLNQGKELLLKSSYLSSETMDEGNCGLSRAEFLKNILVKSGINPDRIVPEAVLSEYDYDTDGNNNNAISLLFRNISEERAVDIEAGIANKTLYSDFGEAEFKADRTLQGYAYGLKNYLNKYPGKTVTVTGHTDNVGDPASNMNLGQQRADLVKNYLASQGIDASKLISTSKGETDPVASNDTDEGRALNRRIQITVN